MNQYCIVGDQYFTWVGVPSLCGIKKSSGSIVGHTKLMRNCFIIW